MSDEGHTPEEDKEPETPKVEVVPELSKFGKIKKFVKDNQTVLACSATAGFVGTVVYTSLIGKIELGDLELSRLRGQFDELYTESGLQMEFIDHKNLRDKYFAWLKEQELAEAIL